ncbi:membrane protein, partial [Streptomyces sp. NRRL WC-3753]
LPEACSTLSKKTLKDLVPDADSLKGKTGKSDDTASRATCSWNSLDTKGVDGSQFRWLHVSLMRFDSDEALGSGAKRAEKYYAKQIADAKATEDAKEVAAEPVSGTGDAATVVSYELKKKEGTFKQQSLVTRVENVVVTVDYNGAGLAGQSSPKTAGLVED